MGCDRPALVTAAVPVVPSQQIQFFTIDATEAGSHVAQWNSEMMRTRRAGARGVRVRRQGKVRFGGQKPRFIAVLVGFGQGHVDMWYAPALLR
jgi:hypothetical protein